MNFKAVSFPVIPPDGSTARLTPGSQLEKHVGEEPRTLPTPDP